MQDVIEVIKITQNEDTNQVSKIRKTFEWRDVISIEEAVEEVKTDLNELNLCHIQLTFDNFICIEKYSTIKKLWLQYREQAKKDDERVSNVIKQ
jgi:hypothetical protein